MTETKWLDADESQAWRSYIGATIRVQHACNTSLLAATGLNLDDYGILVALSEAPDHRVRMSELAEMVGTSPSRLTYRIDRLAKMDYICRSACPEDGRSSYAVLTPTGEKGLEAASHHHVANVREYLVDVITPEELAALGTTLEKVSQGLRPQ